MKFKNEDHLYYATLDAFKELRKRVKDSSFLRALVELPETREIILGGHNFHVVAENSHISHANVRYIHENIVPQITAHPEQWLYLREGKDDDHGATASECQDLKMIPAAVYKRHLAPVLGIPEGDALASIFLPETRAYIVHAAGITDDDLDMLLIGLVMGMKISLSDTPPQPNPKNLEYLARDIGKPIAHVSYLIATRSKDIVAAAEPAGFETQVGRHWNDYSRERLPHVLARYPERTHVLVSVGVNHLPVFDDRK